MRQLSDKGNMLSGITLILALTFTVFPSTMTKAQEGAYHVVEKGQTLFRISLTYRVPIASLMEVNRLASPSTIYVGQRLFIPGAKTALKVEPYRPLTEEERGAAERSLSEEGPEAEAPSKPGIVLPKPSYDFAWPLIGPINSPYGPRRGRLHTGIDIGSPHYQEVVAAADGEVIYVRRSKSGLGNAVFIRHGEYFSTVYAHLSVVIAQEGESVRQGQPIGGVGATGKATGPHLHFEVRYKDRTLNPRDLLPLTLDELVEQLGNR